MRTRGMIYTPAPLNRQHPLARGLVSFHVALPGLDAGKTFYDIAGFNHCTMQTLVAGDGFQPSNRPGGFGAAVTLDGTATCTKGAPGVISNFPCTFACWYAPTVNSSEYGLMSIDDGTSGNHIAMEQFGNKIGAYLGNGSGEVLTTTTVGASKTWNFATATFVQNVQLAYLNGGGKSAAGSKTSTVSGLAQFRLGNNEIVGIKLSGQIDCCMVYNRALSDQEVMWLYLETKMGCPFLLRHAAHAQVAQIAYDNSMFPFTDSDSMSPYREAARMIPY